ncbi:MAG: hypothetical protein ACLVJH_14375 [Faecalibacterium prausnitzii]
MRRGSCSLVSRALAGGVLPPGVGQLRPPAYACTDAAGQALRNAPRRSRAAPFLLEVSCDPARLGLTGYPAARRYAAVPLCQHLLGYAKMVQTTALPGWKALDEVLKRVETFVLS